MSSGTGQHCTRVIKFLRFKYEQRVPTDIRQSLAGDVPPQI